MKTGIIMEGGAMRGMFTAGVLDVFMENDVTFDGAIGVSAGGVFGCNYKSRQIGRTIRYNKRFCNNPEYCSMKSLIRTGDLYGVDFCYRQLPYELDIFDTDTFEKNPMKFYVVVTDMDTGKPVYVELKHGDGKDMTYFRATASLPIVSRPVVIDGHKYCDGGCADSIPLHYFESIGYDRNVVLLTQPKGYRKKKSRLKPVVDLLLRNYPEIRKDLDGRAARYNEIVDEIDSRDDIFTIYPPEPLGIGTTEKNPDELERVYQIGRKTAEGLLDDVRIFLKGEDENEKRRSSAGSWKRHGAPAGRWARGKK